ncbi:MAG: GspMb/PilO family protein [Balneolales bacterium]
MNYGLRNTIILAITLILMVGGGWLIIRYIYVSTIEELEEERVTKESTMSELSETAALYEHAVREHARQVYIRDNHPKELFADPNTSRLYDYLRELNRGISFTELNYLVQDSVAQDLYGIINITVRGEGLYRNLFNFIYRIEHSRPILHIRSLQLQNISELEQLTQVSFQLTLQAYYNRDENLDTPVTLAVAGPFGNIGHNPYFPLIHPIPPNEDNLVNVNESRLMGMTARYILIRDQDGQTHRMTVGDRVYLGFLRRIDSDSRQVVFRLNRGGLVEDVTLNLN